MSRSYGVTNRLYGFADRRQTGNLSYLKISVKSLESTSHNFQVKLLCALSLIVFQINHRKLVTHSVVISFLIRVKGSILAYDSYDLCILNCIHVS